MLVLCPLTAQAGTLLRIGNGPEPESLDPQRMSSVSALNIARDLYEGLTRIGADGEIEPAAAWGWQIADGGRRYTFDLRPNLRWSNGAALTAQDFVAALRRVVDPATGAPYAQLFAPIVNAAAITAGHASPDTLAVWALGPSRLQILLKQPAPYFLGLLAHPASFPIYLPALAQYGRAFARPGRLVSNGAYRLEAWRVESQVALQRNRQYWDDAHTQIDRVQYVAGDDVAAQLQRYRAGELDVTSEVPLVQAPRIRADEGSELHVAAYLGSYFYGINMQRAPLGDHLALRRALAMAIDRELIVDKVMNGLALPAYGWVPPGVSGYQAQLPDWARWPYARRLAEAQRLLADAGYSAAHPLQVEIRYNTHDDHKRIATVIAAMWKQRLGVQATLVNEENKVFFVHRRLGLTQIFRAAWIGDFDDALSFLDVLRAGNGRNDEHWHDTAYDALLQRASSQSDPAARAALLEAAERRALAAQPFIPIYWYVSKHLVKPRVHGWRDNLLDVHYSKDLGVDG
ncbi:peptide ABC transporter substrate-binding protein [Solimonas marina]|uniref:Peptide ABC transporter substrate-binding protein n=1 Tax=Solimonas marina TaxID=2714601 RepID=A0A969WFV3_9GAMM|nr:peptide ABC transporter substrate-binding protein [Solimonas marina]NKF23955.1 peptide ABC transporter substrate-binding protein [Solimonas marina]